MHSETLRVWKIVRGTLFVFMGVSGVLFADKQLHLICGNNASERLIATCGFLLLYIFLKIPAIIIHELGHAITFKMVGAQVLRIRFGLDPYPEGPALKFRFIFNWEIYHIPIAGSVSAILTDTDQYRTRLILAIVAGPVASLLASFTGLGFWALHSHQLVGLWGFTFFYLNLALFLSTIIPYREEAKGKKQPYPNDIVRILEVLAMTDDDVVRKTANAQLAVSQTSRLDFYLTELLTSGTVSEEPKAKQLADQLVELADSPTSHATRASIMIDLGEHQEGRDILKLVLGHFTTPFEQLYTHLFLAIAEDGLGNSESAHFHAQAAYQIDPNAPVLNRLPSHLRTPLFEPKIRR